MPVRQITSLPTSADEELVFDPGGCIGRLRGCQFLGGWHALQIGWDHLDAAIVAEAGGCLVHRGVEHHFQERTSDSNVLRSITLSLQPG